MIVSLFAAVPMTVNAAPPGGSGSGEIGTEIGGSTPVITPTTAGDVAEIGGTGYATLAAAINAAQTGDTIKLLASVEETLTISNKTLTIDLNGFNIISKTKSQPITADNGTKLTIVNTNTDKAENTPTQNAIMGPSGGNNYGSLIAKGNTTVEINASYYYGYNGNKTAIHALNGATITINDCVVNGAQGIDDTTTGKEGKVFYSGVSNPTQPYATSPGTIIVHGGTFAGRMSDSNWGNYVIDGGTFDRNTVILNENPVDANGNRVATASGSMATLPNSPGTLEEAGWLAPGYNVVNNGNGTYGVEKTKAVEAYDANGDLVGAYTSIDAAIEAGGDGCTVKLVADLYEQQQINSQKTPVTLDLNGHMINVEGGAGLNFSMGYYWNGDHIFTVKDTVGTGGINITPKYTGNACISDNTGRTIIVEGGTFTSTGKAIYCTASNATFTVIGGTFNGDIYVHDTGYGHGTLAITDGTVNGTLSAVDNAVLEVSGGVFNAPVPEVYCADGYKPVDNGNGTYGVTPKTYVAQVGDVKYETFAEAVAARTSTNDVIELIKAAGTYTMTDVDEAPIKVQKNSKSVTIKAPANVPKVVTSATADGVTTYTLSDATVKHTAKNGNVTYYTASDLSSLNSDGTYQLLTDITRTQRMAFGNWANDVTIDLNGHTLTSTASDCAVTLGRAGSAASPKTFALVDTSTNKGGKLVFTTAPSTNTEAILVSGKYNNVTIGEGVTVQGGAVALMGENQTLTVNGTINGGDDFAIVTNGSSTKNATITVNDGAVVTSNSTAMYLPGTGTTTINGGTITGDTAIYIKSGTLDVKGGTITGNGAKADYTYNGSGANATGDAIVVDSCGYPGGAPTVTISGNPTVTSTNGKQIGDYSYGNNALGEVTATSSTMTLPTGLKWVETDTPGVYEVGQKLFVGHNLLLGGDIGVNFYLNPVILDSYNGTKTVKFTCDGEETTVNVPATPTANGYKVTLNVVAARMAHKINAVVYVNNGSTALAETDSYSVQDYAEAVFAEPAKYTTANKADALKALAKAMLNYGAQAQNVFASSLKDKTPAPANTTVGNNGYSAVTVGDVQNAINGDASDLTAIAAQLNAEYYTSSLIYLQNNTLRIYFTPKSKQLGGLAGMGFDGALSNYYYYKDVEGIAAAELDEQQTFDVNGVEFQYSALDYVVAVLNSGNKMNDAQKDLAKSLFLYNQAANAYFD